MRPKTFKMPGFREGKVPVSIVKQKLGQEKTNQEIQQGLMYIKKPLPENEGMIFLLPFKNNHLFQGTRDVSSFLTIPKAIKFREKYNWNHVSELCKKMILDYQKALVHIIKQFQKGNTTFTQRHFKVSMQEQKEAVALV